MDAVFKWLDHERSPMWLLGFALLVALADLLLHVPIGWLMESHMPSTNPEMDHTIEEILGKDYLARYPSAVYHAGIAGAAFFFAMIEEILFRTLPLGLAIGAQRKSWVAVAMIVAGAIVAGSLAYDNLGYILKADRDPKILLALGVIMAHCIMLSLFVRSPFLLVGIVLSSSALFAYVHHGWVSMPLQGLGGVAFSLVYLKAGGLQGRWAKGTWYASVAHTAFNLVLFEILLLALVYGVDL